jgi:hypothetical protein
VPPAPFATVMPEANFTMVGTFQLRECGNCTVTFSRVLASFGWVALNFRGSVWTSLCWLVWKIRVTE